MPKVSVVIPTYNRAHLLPLAIGSVQSQTLGDTEIIVVDDGSTDDTEAIVTSTPDRRIRYVRSSTNQGSGAARNRGVEVAQGEYIAFLDSDDEWLPAKLEKQIRLMESVDRSVGICRTGFLCCRPNGRELSFYADPAEDADALKLHIEGRLQYVTPSLIFRRACLHGNWFDERLRRGQDSDLLLVVLRKTRLVSLPEPLVKVHVGKHIPSSTAVESARLRILDKHREWIRQECPGLEKRFEANQYRIIAESKFRTGNIWSGCRYALRCYRAWQRWPLGTYLRTAGHMGASILRAMQIGLWPKR
jgi:glycosyltransferase involved in cell wall biosynthesis